MVMESNDSTEFAAIDSNWQTSVGWLVFGIVFWCWLIVTAVIGNVLVLLCVLRTKRLHTSTYVFYGSLAVADLLVGEFYVSSES